MRDYSNLNDAIVLARSVAIFKKLSYWIMVRIHLVVSLRSHGFGRRCSANLIYASKICCVCNLLSFPWLRYLFTAVPATINTMAAWWFWSYCNKMKQSHVEALKHHPPFQQSLEYYLNAGNAIHLQNFCRRVGSNRSILYLDRSSHFLICLQQPQQQATVVPLQALL